jgi:hypothetical protein
MDGGSKMIIEYVIVTVFIGILLICAKEISDRIRLKELEDAWKEISIEFPPGSGDRFNKKYFKVVDGKLWMLDSEGNWIKSTLGEEDNDRK